MRNSKLISIDLAKSVLQVCKIGNHGELIANKAVSPSKLKQFLAKSSPSIVAMEGCGTCHYRGRLAHSFGHEVR